MPKLSARPLPADADIIDHEGPPHVRIRDERSRAIVCRLSQDGRNYLRPSKNERVCRPEGDGTTGLTGEARFMLYLVAGTGFRANALANLTPGDFDCAVRAVPPGVPAGDIGQHFSASNANEPIDVTPGTTRPGAGPHRSALNYPARIRTWTKRTKISCATVTLPGSEGIGTFKLEKRLPGVVNCRK